MTSTVSELQVDHKQWLRDIDRWTFYLDSWQKQIGSLTRECHHLLTIVEQYADDLEEFHDAIESLRNWVVIHERAMIGSRRPVERDTEFDKSHEANAARHEELYKMHERLKQTQHTLMMGLALLKHEPVRGE